MAVQHEMDYGDEMGIITFDEINEFGHAQKPLIEHSNLTYHQ